MKLNTKPKFTETTHEGAPAARMTPEQALRRSVMSCLLWEREFYEDGEAIADRIERLCSEVEPMVIANLAVEARTVGNLRHVPLLLLCGLIKHGRGVLVSVTIEEVIQRADELTELLAMYWRNGKIPMSNQMKDGLAAAFGEFDAYQLAKYNRDGAVKLRDVLFLCHAKPKDEAQAAIWKQLIDGTLPAPDTWEVALSAGADKRETFERLLREGNLGYLALLRNLRNMVDAGVDDQMIRRAILERKGGADKVLPFRFVAAARVCPQFERELDSSMEWSIERLPRLAGRTIVLVDVSGSMGTKLSAKSDLSRMDAAAALASIVNVETLRVFSFSDDIVEVPPRRGMAGIDAVVKSQMHSCTELGSALNRINTLPHDRLIVISDEQTAGRVPDPAAKHAYMINVASSKNGVGYGRWTHIDGFSENVLRFIHDVENTGE